MTGVTVVKVGGHEVDDALWLASLAELLRSVGPVVVVHGGGKEVTRVQERLGLEPEWRDGLRVTTEAGMAAVSMVLSGLVNKRLVSALVTAGSDALGVSGEDGGLLRAEPALGGTLGRVGVVTQVRTSLLTTLLAAGITPVVSPVARGGDGGALNVNADDAAAAVAAALGARRLLFVSNVPGVLSSSAAEEATSPPAVATTVASPAEAEAWIDRGFVSGGMVPKLRAAARAASAGVADVRIGDLSLLDGGAGTRVLAPAERVA